MALIDDIRALPVETLGTRDTAQIAAALNTGRARLGAVSRARFAIWAAAGPRAVIEDEAANPSSDYRASALTLKDLLVGAADELDLADPQVSALLAQWHAGGKIGDAEHAALIALATVDDPIDEMTVRAACWSDAGEWLP